MFISQPLIYYTNVYFVAIGNIPGPGGWYLQLLFVIDKSLVENQIIQQFWGTRPKSPIWLYTNAYYNDYLEKTFVLKSKMLFFILED